MNKKTINCETFCTLFGDIELRKFRRHGDQQRTDIYFAMLERRKIKDTAMV